MLIIDTHAHIYSPDEKKYPPTEKPYRPPAGRGSLEHLRLETKAHGVEKACLVQATTFYGWDNRYIRDCAHASREWAAGVCTLDPDDPHSPFVLDEYARDFNIRGTRSYPARSKRLDDPGVRAVWKKAADRGLVVNILIDRNNAGDAARMLKEFKPLRVVLDHCLNLKAGPDMEAILADVLRLAENANLHAKLTFLATGSTTGFPCADMHAPCLKIVEAFGAERCVWGSDFPNSLWTPKVSYGEYLRLFTEVLPLKDEQRRAILGETARRLWFR
jgi:predicted TIM-barrel fold metal-dependent hydrolase